MSNIKADSVDRFLILMKLLILEKKAYIDWTDSKAFINWLLDAIYSTHAYEWIDKSKDLVINE